MAIATAMELGFRDKGAGVRVRGKGLRMVWRLGWKKAPTELCRAQKVRASGYKAPIYGIHKGSTWIRGVRTAGSLLGSRQFMCWVAELSGLDASAKLRPFKISGAGLCLGHLLGTITLQHQSPSLSYNLTFPS